MNARCDNDHCKELNYQEPEEAMKCTVTQTMVEDVEGNDCSYLHLLQLTTMLIWTGLETLPGGVSVN
jgi:hypothetical protein